VEEAPRLLEEPCGLLTDEDEAPLFGEISLLAKALLEGPLLVEAAPDGPRLEKPPL
jgi:hypothetical protein